MAVRRPREAMRSRVPPQVCSTSSRWAAIARTSAAGGLGTESAAMASVDGVVAVVRCIHVGHVIGRAGNCHILVVDRRAVHGGVDVHLSALRDINLVQAGDRCNAGRVAHIWLQQGDRVVGGVDHGEAAVGLTRRGAHAVGALGHADPERMLSASSMRLTAPGAPSLMATGFGTALVEGTTVLLRRLTTVMFPA